MPESLYVYAITARDVTLPASLVGLDGHPLDAIPYRDLAAIVSVVATSRLRPVDHVLRHEAVVEAIRDTAPALPVRFGTILQGRDAVTLSLANRHDTLVDDLARLGDKVEMGVTAIWEGSPAADDEPLSVAADTAGEGTRYLAEKLALYRRQQAREREAQDARRELDRCLGADSLDTCHTILQTGNHGLRATYLLPPTAVPAFREHFEALRRRHTELRLTLTGPWPPYTFVGAGEPAFAKRGTPPAPNATQAGSQSVTRPDTRPS